MCTGFRANNTCYLYDIVIEIAPYHVGCGVKVLAQNPLYADFVPLACHPDWRVRQCSGGR